MLVLRALISFFFASSYFLPSGPKREASANMMILKSSVTRGSSNLFSRAQLIQKSLPSRAPIQHIPQASPSVSSPSQALMVACILPIPIHHLLLHTQEELVPLFLLVLLGGKMLAHVADILLIAEP